MFLFVVVSIFDTGPFSLNLRGTTTGLLRGCLEELVVVAVGDRTFSSVRMTAGLHRCLSVPRIQVSPPRWFAGSPFLTGSFDSRYVLIRL